MTGDDASGGVKHGFSGAMYVGLAEGRVQVTMPDGRRGIFNGIGRWIEGELYDADPEMCGVRSGIAEDLMTTTLDWYGCSTFRLETAGLSIFLDWHSEQTSA